MIKVVNAISELENSSRRYVPHESYYIIHVKLISSIIEDIAKFVSRVQTAPNVERMPLVIYVSPLKDELWVLFSSVAVGEHNFGGCHQTLVSYFSSFVSIECGGRLTKAWIIELNSRTKIIEYFHSIIFMNMYKRAGSSFPTIIDAIESFPRDKWDQLPSHEKYGTFYKSKGGTMSEEIDYRNMAKYQTYFFG
jgi:hypothetical protein